MFARKKFTDKLRSNAPGIITAIILSLLPVLGVRGYWLSILTRINIFLVFAIALDFFSGTTFYLNLGFSFIVGLAAYTLALLNIYLGVPVWAAIFISTAATCLLSLILFLPSIRVKGVYFAIMSLLFPIIFIGIATTQPFSMYLGGEGGLMSQQLFLSIASKLPPGYALLFLQFSYYYLSLILAIVSFIVLYRLAYSDFGFMLRAIGQDEELAEVSGIDTVKVKLKGFLIASFFAGLAGSFYAAIQPPVTLDFVSTSTILLPILTAMIVGGIGTIIGPAIAIYFLMLVYEFLWGIVGEWRTIIYMVLLLVFIIVKPRGIMYYIYARLMNTLRRRSRR